MEIAELQERLRESENARWHTEAKLTEALAFAESIVDTVREPMLVLDGQLRIQMASRAFYQIFGGSHEDTEDKLLYDLGDGQWNIPVLRTLLEEVLPRDTSVSDFEVTHDFPVLGRRVMLLNCRKLWREGDHPQRILLAIEDITERKRIQDELLRSNEDLQGFAYVAAHDLRSPLNAALKLSALLSQRLEGMIGKEDWDMLTLSIDNLKRLGALMQDILAYAEIGNAPQQRTLVALEEPLKIALANLQHHIERQGAIIGVGELPKVPVGRTQMAMVFQNLIGNAIKYRRDEAPRISIDALQEGSDWRLSVSDNGQGFKAEYARRIFEPFKRLHGPNVPGSGIGLATCKRIIERLGGRIWAESTPGEGSTFYFTIPIEQK